MESSLPPNFVISGNKFDIPFVVKDTIGVRVFSKPQNASHIL
jgi:hypothetical protein